MIVVTAMPLILAAPCEFILKERTFDYSATGNMWVTTASTNFAAGSFTPRTSTWYNANNRLVNTGLGITYDSAGNQTAIGGYANTFDAENRLTSSTINSVTTSYAYDGEGRRVKKGSMVMVYDASGNLAAEYGGAVTSAGREYLTGDSLGSTRLVTNASGTATKCADYLPFGEEISQGVNGRGTCYGFTDPRQKFTGKNAGQPDPSHLELLPNSHACRDRQSQARNAEDVEIVWFVAVQSDGSAGKGGTAVGWGSHEPGAFTVDILWYSLGKALYDAVERSAVHENSKKSPLGRVGPPRAPALGPYLPRSEHAVRIGAAGGDARGGIGRGLGGRLAAAVTRLAEKSAR
jgi:YD repeat-containing protein